MCGFKQVQTNYFVSMCYGHSHGEFGDYLTLDTLHYTIICQGGY
jgi:hypothetical protein